MNLLKRLRPLMEILGLMTLSAVCAMAQAEINPDHFDDNPPQAPAIHMPAQHPSSAAVTHPSQPASEVHRSGGSVAAGKSTAHQGSASETEGVSSSYAVSRSSAQKRHKKLISEARHHGMP